MTTTIETPRPEAPPYNWTSHDLKNLVMLAPNSPYTRALLRIKFNCPVPDGATTFEQIEAWLATVKPIPKQRLQDFYQSSQGNSPTHEISRGEYIAVDANETGYNNYTRNWTKAGCVQVPLSVWEQGLNDVQDYVQSEISELDECESDDLDFESSGNDGNLSIENDLDALMEEAETLIANRDRDDDDDDEDDDDEE